MKVPIRNIATVTSGNSAPQDKRLFINGEYPFIRTGDVGRVHYDDCFTSPDDYLNEEGIKRMRKFPKYSILFPKSGASTLLNHRVMLGEDSYVVSHLAVIIPDTRKVLPKYLYYATINIDAGELVEDKAYPSLRTSVIENIKINLPDVKEQERIVSELDLIMGLISKKKSQIRDLDALADSIFYEMFGNAIENDRMWEQSSLGKEFEIASGGTPDTKNKEYWENGNISWIGSNLCQNVVLYENDGKFITQQGFDHSSAKQFLAGFVLIALVGATIGKTALLRFNTTTNQNVAGINVLGNSRYTPEFVFYLVQHLYPLFMNIGDGKFKMANLSFIRNLPIIIPPYEQQRLFSERINLIESQRKKISLSLDNLDVLLKNQMSKHFG